MDVEIGTIPPADLPASTVVLIQQILDVSQSYVILVVTLFGLFDNTLSIVIFFRLRKRSHACIQYLTCLAVSDNAVLSFSLA
jgi:hypothetical protein